MPLVWRTLPWLVLAVTLGLAALAMSAPLQALLVHVPLNYNEGWNAFHALRLRSGGPLYPPVSPDVFINYPPLSFYIVAALHPLIGDDIFAGRLVALAAELVVALNIALAARALNVRWVLAGVTAFAFLAFVALYYPDYVAMDDPQWLGHALQTTALVILLRRNRFDWATLLLVAVLCLAGGLAKQNLIALPLAITLWLAIEDRNALLRWLASGIGVAMAALAVLVALYGQGFIDQVLRSERSYWTIALAFVAQNLSVKLAPYLVFAVAGTLLQRADRGARLSAIYLVVSIITGIGMLAIDGVAYNALFDLTIAMLLGTALLGQWLVARLGGLPALTRAGPMVAALVLALPILSAARLAVEAQPDLRLDLMHQNTWQQAIDRIAAAPGPVACEMLSLCYWAGRSSEIDFFNFGQYATLHPTSAAPLASRLAGGALALIQEDGASGSRRLPPAVDAVIAARYAPLQTAPTMLLLPKPR